MLRARWSAPAPLWLAFPILLGLYLTAHGYHSRDGDQAYRLPLLLHLQAPALFADDPFVRAFDAFNPHLGYLGLLDLASRPFGLSIALFGLFLGMFSATALGIDRLARSCWPEAGRGVGVVAVVLVLLAQAGNIGTNHLFEATLLDRLLAMSLGWLGLSFWVAGMPNSRWIAAPLIGLAAWIHPSMGLQLAMLLGGAWGLNLVVSRLSREFPPEGFSGESRAGSAGLRSIRPAEPALLVACLIPALLAMGRQKTPLFQGLSTEDFRILSAYVQSPQHMIPHLWRTPQWLAWGCYPVLAGLTLIASPRPWPESRKRITILLGVGALGLTIALGAIEGLADLRVTVFQPFRLATVFRGLCLVAVADRIIRLWGGDFFGKSRAVVIASGLIGDWTLVAATAVEIAASIPPFSFPRSAWECRLRRFASSGFRIPRGGDTGDPSKRTQSVQDGIPTRSAGTSYVGLVAFLGAIHFLSKHDTESGHLRFAVALAALVTYLAIQRSRPIAWDRKRAMIALSASWALPIAALLVQTLPIRGKIAESLAARCHFAEVPVGDVERLAVWCRDHTPESARFIGPPGPKDFRLWSRRSLAFNRAGSPYHAAGLADWAARFRDHVGYDGPLDAFASAYLADRHGLEHRFDTFNDDQLAALAIRQGADHVLKARPSKPDRNDGPLELLRVEGRYAVYRVRTSYPAASLANASD